MRVSRRAAAVFGAALLSSGLTVVSPVLTAPASAAAVVVDGGFEAAAGDPAVSPGWTAAGSESDTPICTPASCPAPPPEVGPHTGDNYVYFGAVHTASIQQTVTLPQGSATLSYWYARPWEGGREPETLLEIRIDGKRAGLIHEFEWPIRPIPYELRQLDISEFADGGPHTLAFVYVNDLAQATSMVLDDISIETVAGPALVQADPRSLGPIPDAPDGCLQVSGPPRDVTFTVAGKVGRPTDVGVRIAFDPEHTYAGNVVAELIAPDGSLAQVFGLLDHPYSPWPADVFTSLVGPYLFTDHAPLDPTMQWAAVDAEEEAVPPGHYRSTYGGLITPAFADLGNANGTWTLRVRDLCKEDVGTVSAAALLLTTDGIAHPDANPPDANPPDTNPPDTEPPDTHFASSPENGIAKSLQVPFSFVSDETGVTFECSLDQAPYAVCANPATVTVEPGSHTLRVRARDVAGNLDPDPAATSFTAYDCKTLNAKVATLAKKVKKVKKAIKQTKSDLAQAVGNDDQAKVHELEAKLAKQQKKKTKKAKKLATAKQAATPCQAKG